MASGGRAFRLKQVARSPHFWIVLTLLAALSLLHYVEQLGIVGTSPSYHFGLVRHSIDRILLLAPAVYAGFFLGLRAGLVTCFIAFLIMLPRSLLFSPSPADALLESAGIVILGGLVCFLFKIRHEMDMQRRQSATDLETMQQELQSHIRLSRSNEKRLATLNAISALLSRSLDMRQVLRAGLDMLMEVMEVEAALIFSLDERTQELKLIAYEGMSEKFAQSVNHLKVGEGFNGEVALTGESVVIENASRDPRLSRQMVRDEKIEAQLIVPLRSRGLIVGTLCVANRRPRQFLSEEVELLTAIGSQVGITIENTRLYQEQQAIAEQYRGIFESASDAIWVHDLEGNIITANDATEKLTGYSKEELTHMNVAGFLSEEGLGIAGEVRRKLLRGEVSDGPYDQRLTGRDGTEALMELNSSLVLRDGQPIGFQNVARDVTLEHRLQENLQFYIREVTRAQEEERKRLARELHDETAQRLIALSHHLEHIAASNKRLSAEIIGQLTNLQEGVRDVLKEVRRFSRDLRPSILDDLGLLPAMEWLTDDIREQHGIEANLMITGSQQRLNPEAELLLFRIAQEALNNVRRHAEASKVSVAIEFDEAKMKLMVQDDGKGFQVPNTVGELSRIGKLGLIGMEERTRLLGGSLRVQSEPCQGTTVTVEAPI